MKVFRYFLLLFLFFYGFLVEMRDGRRIETNNVFYERGRLKIDGDSLDIELIEKIYSVYENMGNYLLRGGESYALPDTILLKLAQQGENKYRDADGIILVDWGKQFLDKDGKEVFVYHFAGKILNEKKLDWANRKIYFEEGRNRVRILFGRSINVNGETVWMSTSDIKIFEPPLEGEFFESGKYVSITLPRVSIGSIVEFAYIDSLYNPEIPEFFFSSFYFQDKLPLMWSRYELYIPLDKELLYKTYNFSLIKPDFNSKITNDRKVFIWEAKDVPPVVDEYLMPPYEDLVPKIKATTVKSWNIIFDKISEFQRQRMELTPEIIKFANELTKGAKTDEEKIDRLYRFTQQEIEYVSVKSSFSSGETGHHWSWTLNSHMGDCTDKSILLSTMLNALGYKSAPVVLMTNDNESIDRSIPNLDGNHAIVKLELNGKQYFLDPTATTYKFPYFRSDAYLSTYYSALLREVGTIPVPPAYWNEIKILIDGKINSRGKLYVKYKSIPVGNMEAEFRYWWITENPSNYKRIFEQWVSELFPNGRLKRWYIPNPALLDEPFFEYFEAEVPGCAEFVDNMVIIHFPHFEKEFRFSEATTKERKYPIKYGYNILKEEKVNLELPSDWVIEKTPDSISISNKWGAFTGRFKAYGNKIVIDLTYQRDSLLVSQDEYKEYREFLNSMRRLVKNAVLFKKKK